jgi:hypothetical protein
MAHATACGGREPCGESSERGWLHSCFYPRRPQRRHRSPHDLGTRRGEISSRSASARLDHRVREPVGLTPRRSSPRRIRESDGPDLLPRPGDTVPGSFPCLKIGPARQRPDFSSVATVSLPPTTSCTTPRRPRRCSGARRRLFVDIDSEGIGATGSAVGDSPSSDRQGLARSIPRSSAPDACRPRSRSTAARCRSWCGPPCRCV